MTVDDADMLDGTDTLDGTELWSLSRLGFLLYSRGRLTEAAAIFHGVIQLRPDAAYCWYALGLVRRDQDAFRGAVECLNHAVACDAHFWAARVALAELLREHGYLQDASAVLEPVIEASERDSLSVRRARALARCWR
jgi:tetratricopeptide (TPR) repeat protein